MTNLRVVKVAIDVDEVLSYQAEKMHEVACEAGLVQTLDLEFSKYHHLDYSELWGVFPKVAHEFVIQYLKRNSVKLRLVRGAYETLARLKEYAREQGVDLRFYALTSRSTRLRRATKKQLAHHFPGIFDRVILTGNRKPKPPKRSKLYWYRKLGCDVIIDDGITNVVQCVEGAGGLGIVFGWYFWNRSELPDTNNGSLVRCIDWSEVEEVLRQRIRQILA